MEHALGVMLEVLGSTATHVVVDALLVTSCHRVPTDLGSCWTWILAIQRLCHSRRRRLLRFAWVAWRFTMQPCRHHHARRQGCRLGAECRFKH